MMLLHAPDLSGNDFVMRIIAPMMIAFVANRPMIAPDHFGNGSSMLLFSVDLRRPAPYHSGNRTDARIPAIMKPVLAHFKPTCSPFPKWNPRLVGIVEAAKPRTMNVTCIRAGVKDLSSAALIAKTMHVEECMASNPHFPDPSPTLAELGSARSALQIAAANALGRGRADVAIRWQKHTELERLMVQLSKYVMAKAPGDLVKQLSSGFELRNAPIPIDPIKPPARLNALQSGKEGCVDLVWHKVHGARTYEVFITSEDPTEPQAWHHAAHSTRIRTQVHGLEPGRLYHFRVRAILAAGEGPFSQVASKRAA